MARDFITEPKRFSRKSTERDRQISSQIWKAKQVAKRISSFSGLPYEELRDAALEYIVRVYDTWDQSKGANFSTWVNRCLTFHMMNYLRDNSRLVKIPRSYSDLYLKIRKQILSTPGISDDDIAKNIKVPVAKVRAVIEAFSMSFSEITEYSNIIEPEYETEANMEEFMSSYNELLYKISDLRPEDEAFLTDYLIKKRSVSTIIRKNPHLTSTKDIQSYSEQLINYVLFDTPYPAKAETKKLKEKVELNAI